ncbi:MAG: TerC family protein [Spirochaetia bacterium]|nr:TerC family protein [Spirochaetia bacterium]
MDWIFSPDAWISLATLTLLEIVLGVDNIIFISILVGRLPEGQRQRGRVLGLGLAMGTRILLLLALTWMMRTLIQIALIDIVFSLDSVITAVGLSDHVPVMIIAVMLAVLVMMIAAKAIGDFVDAHPTVKMLALSFLIMVGIALVGESASFHIPKGYIYFAMAFSVLVEMINLRLRKKLDRKPVQLRKELQ